MIFLNILHHPPKNSSNNSSDGKINYSVSNSLTFDARSNDIQFAGSSTKKSNPNNCLNDKINYCISSNSLISDVRSDDIFQFSPSRKIK